MAERCELCKLTYSFAYHAEDGLWEKVTGKADGKWCPTCFTVVAQSKGLETYWRVGPNLNPSKPEREA